MTKEEQIKELKDTLKWIIERIEMESDRAFEGNKPNWKKAAIESVEEAYVCLSLIKENS